MTGPQPVSRRPRYAFRRLHYSTQEAIDILKKQGYDMVPVVSDDNKIMGVVTEGNLMACLLNGRVQPEDVVESVMYKQFKKASERERASESRGENISMT